MKNICVVTGTRAEYGLLRPVMEKIDNDPDLNLQIIATGMHLSPEFGLTYQEIEADGFFIHEKIEMLLSTDTDSGISKSMGLAMIGFADALSRLSPDMMLVLGDRYEIFAAASAGMLMKIPIAHIHGGESTFGAVDESMRHCITKMSHLHFASTEEYRRRIIQLGEQPDRVFYVGSLGVENIKNVPIMTKKDLEDSMGFQWKDQVALVTFHPVTLEEQQSPRIQIKELFKALSDFPNINFIFTKANSDAGGREINRWIDEYVIEHPKNTIAFTSLGMKRYITAMAYSCMVIGNSSSGIIEAPSFHIPTVDIGDRQKGRLAGKSVIHCETTAAEIKKAIERARDKSFLCSIKNEKSSYEKEGTSTSIITIMKEFLAQETIDLKKIFNDIILS